MNRERAKELLPIIEAFANGEAIEFRLSDLEAGADGPLEWLVMPENKLMTLTFPCNDYEYRIKPKPREWFLAFGKSGVEVTPTDDFSKLGGVIRVPNAGPDCEIIKVREVL